MVAVRCRGGAASARMGRVALEERVTLAVASPRVLVALLVVPLFLVTARGALAAGSCRAVAAAALVLALAGLMLVHDRPAGGACVVAAIDVSASVERAAVESARRFLGDLVPTLGEDDVAGSVAFAARAHVVAATAGDHPLAALLPQRDPDDADAGATDLATALATGAALCPEGKQAALLLFTDGNETAGSVLAEAAVLEPRDPVFPVVPPPGRLPPVALRRLLAPALAPAGAPVPLEAVVESRVPGTAAVSLQVDGEAMVPRPVDLPAGISVVGLPYRAGDRGHHLLEARLLLPGTPPLARTVRAGLTVTAPVHVLFVSERGAAPQAERAPVAALVLARRGMRT